MNKKETGGPAYPGYYIDDDGEELYQNGMTLRDYFAGQIVVGILEHSSYDRETAEYAYALADAMLKERNK